MRRAVALVPGRLRITVGATVPTGVPSFEPSNVIPEKSMPVPTDCTVTVGNVVQVVDTGVVFIAAEEGANPEPERPATRVNAVTTP